MQLTMPRSAQARVAAILVGVLVLAGCVVGYRLVSDKGESPPSHSSQGGQQAAAPGQQPNQTPSQAGGGAMRVVGAGTTILNDGTGSSAPTMGTIGVNAEQGKGGTLQFIAFTQDASMGRPGSGVFGTQVMYLTGKIDSIDVTGQNPDFTAHVRGTVTVTGRGAGKNVPLEGAMTSGGPGTTFELKFSGQTLNGIMTDGVIHVTHQYTAHQ
jgi:hypothetical protein